MTIWSTLRSFAAASTVGAKFIQQMRDSGARVLFVLENFAPTVEAAANDLKVDQIVIVKPGDLLGLKGHIINLVSRYVKKAVKPFSLKGAIAFREVMAKGAQVKPNPVTVVPDDLAFLQYTGGTTGVAKGAMLLHRNVAANVMQCEAWMVPYFGDRTDHVMVTALPLYHIFGLTACALLMLKIGGCQLLITNPRDIPAFVKTLKTRPFTLISGVNTLYNALAHAPGIEDVDFSSLVFAISGGMATQAAVAQKWKDGDRHADCRRIRAVRDFPGRVRQPSRHQGLHRDNWLSGSVHGHIGACGQTIRSCRSASAANSA